MDRFEAMEIFTRVVEANSFSRVSEMLSLSPAKISRTIQTLEERIGVRLLNRSTRHISITEEGALYYERCIQILKEVSETEASLSDMNGRHSGTIRVDTSGTLARALLLPSLDEFYQRYPEIDVRLGLGDRNVDLFEDGVDCAIRMGALEESSLFARRIGIARIVTCASPLYLRQHGLPTTLDELAKHRAVNYVSARTRRTIPFEFDVDGEIRKVEMRSALAVNDGSTYVSAGVLGYGIIQPSRFLVADFIAQDALREILTPYEGPCTPLSIVYPHRRNRSSRLRVFVDWVDELARRHPDLSSSSHQVCQR